MRNNLKSSEDEKAREVTRVGVYGVVIQEGQMLLIRQKKGPYTGKFDFPGGGIEFGESPEQTLRREFVEEVAMEFDSLQLIDNITATIDVSAASSNEAYAFFHVGMIYRIHGCRQTREQAQQELQHIWIDPKILSMDQCSSLLWKYKQIHLDG
jgi:ADP-ribose pyrophosphatase YjhB (NUDIX family)